MSNQQMTGTNETGMTVREGFGEVQQSRPAETASTAVAEQAKSRIQARYIVAMQRPRSWDDVRVRLLRECDRPGFADCAIYHKPIGKGVEGPSIRFAEAAIRCMTNVDPESYVVYDDDAKRIMRVSVTDLEGNVTYSKDVVIDKTVEHSTLKQGETALGVRTNSKGKTTYLVDATEDDLLNKQNAIESKALRVLALRHLPGDIMDECIRRIYETRKNRDAQDPDAAKKKIVDGFASLNVMPSELERYLGHDVGVASPAELNELRGVFAAIRDGEASWTSAIEHRLARRDVVTETPAAASLESKAKIAAAKARAQAAASTAAEVTTTTTATTPATERTPGEEG